MTTGRPAKRAARTTSTRTTATRASQRSTTQRSTARRRTSTSATRRRRTPTAGAAIGAALGTLVITRITAMSWGARIGLIALALLAFVAYALWRHRGEILSAGQTGAQDPDPTDQSAAGPEPETEPDTEGTP